LKSQLNLKKAIITVLFVIIGSAVFAQTGRISGKVSDGKTGETLIGVTVKIAGTTKGSATDVEGRYVIGTVAPGKYVLEASYVGFSTKKITDIEVKSGATTTVDLILDESTDQKLNEVVITASIRQETVNALYSSQKNSISISSGIVSDQIKRSPDRNTSEVLKRVSGASIQDGKFLIIRGLSDRYNAALINNAILPSSEPDRRAFSFDIIPSNLIDKIVINKTASPDLPGDFAGGVTQILTKDIPSQDFLNVSISTGYNSQSTFKDFYSGKRYGSEYLGFTSSERKLPASFPSSRAVYAIGSVEDRVNNTKMVRNNFSERNYVALPSSNLQVNWGVVKPLSDYKFGSILSLNYRNGQNIQDAFRESFDGVNTVYEYNDQNYRFNTNIGALANFALVGSKNKFSFKNVFNQSLEDSYTNRSGYNQNQNSDLKYSSSELNQKSFLNSQLGGEHQIGGRNIKLDWNLNYSLISREQPDLRSIYYLRSVNTDNPYQLNNLQSRRFFSDLSENVYGGSTSVLVPFDLFNRKSSVKAGFMKQLRIRNFDARIFNYVPARQQDFDASKLLLPKDVIFASENIAQNGFIFDEITNNQDSYDGKADLNAGFLMLDNRLTDNLRFIWGARVEDYLQNIEYTDQSGIQRKSETTFFDFLPSGNLSYALNEKSNLRVSGSRTVSRPELRELAPFTFINQEENIQVTGNPNLKRSQNTNLDLRYEIYPSAGEAFTFSVFYKNFKNPIEQQVSSSSTPDNIKFGYFNAKSAYSVGAELDVRKNLGFINSGSDLFKNLTAYANVTFIKSEVDQNQAGLSKRALQGQSPYLVNGGLQYSETENGLSFNILYNRIGQRIYTVGNVSSGFLDIYENSRDVIDFQIAKKVFKKRGEIKLNIGDLLNQDQALYQNYDGNKTYNKGKDVEFFRMKPGSNFSIGLSYDIK
jgi:outer membrane receptor protein involved in Fe transport